MPSVRSTIIAMLAAVTFTLAVTPSYALNPFKRSNFQLEDGDIPLLEAAAQKLYLVEAVDVGAVESWNNAESGNYGTVTLIQKHAHQGLPCRRLQHDIKIKGEADPYRFIIDRCKTEDGSWKLL